MDHFIVHPNNYEEWERLCEALARHCREAGFEVAAWEVCNEPDIGESGGTPHYFKSTGRLQHVLYPYGGRVAAGRSEAKVGGPAVANANSMLVEGLIEHCATQGVPLHFISWHLYSDSPEAHAANIARQRARLAKFPQLRDVKLFISEWNMDLMRPNLAPGFQPCFVLETMRRYAEQGLDMAAYYHIRDCFVDPADFDWMSPDGRRFMAHWWNTMPQYSALFDHHGRVRPAWYAFRLLGQLQGPRYAVEGEEQKSGRSRARETATNISWSGGMRTADRRKSRCASASRASRTGTAGWSNSMRMRQSTTSRWSILGGPRTWTAGREAPALGYPLARDRVSHETLNSTHQYTDLSRGIAPNEHALRGGTESG